MPRAPCRREPIVTTMACGEMSIRRLGFIVMENHVVNGKCAYRGQPIPGVWE